MMRSGIQIHYDYWFDGCMRDAAAVGFQNVSVAFSDKKSLVGDEEFEKTVRHVNAVLAETGLICTQTHLPTYHPPLSAEIVDADTEKAVVNGLYASARIGARFAAYHPRSKAVGGTGEPGCYELDYDPEGALQANLETVSGYAAHAKKAGVILALENLPYLPTTPKLFFYVQHCRELKTLIDALDHPNVAACWDFGHANLASHWLGFDHAEAVRDMGKRIVCTHVHNNRRTNDDHLPPSFGDMDWKLLLGALKATGYTGTLMLEPWEINDETRLSYYRHLYECADKLARTFDAL